MSTEVSYSTVNLHELALLVQELVNRRVEKAVLENLNDSYKIQMPSYDPYDLPIIAKNIEQRACKLRADKSITNSSRDDEHWFLGEKSLFFCVLGFYAFLKKLNIETIKEKQILPLQKIFSSKSPKMLLFEVKHLLSLSLKADWFEEDIEVLEQIMNSYAVQTRTSSYSVKWKHIAYDLFLQSTTGEFYSARDCRNKWLSHLNPEINKRAWSIQEELYLCQLIQEFGCKWSQISRKMGGVRTQHMVKNKANSLIKIVFKRRFKVILERHVIEIINFLQNKMKKETNVQATENINLYQTGNIQVEIQKIEEPWSNEEHMQEKHFRELTEFDEPFKSSRLVMISSDIEENWEYNQEIHQFDFNCLLSLN